MDAPSHIPVLLDEALGVLQPHPGGVYVDATTGLGGHAEEILRRSDPATRLIALDQDAHALTLAQERLRPFGDRVRFIHSNFAFLSDVLDNCGISVVDGVLMDLGVSSYQLESGGRGFSFLRDEPLDMRMNPETGQPASNVVNHWDAELLEAVFQTLGEERWSRRIAQAIARQRRTQPIRTTGELATLVERVVPRSSSRIHPATRVFQALRMEVNDELGCLERGLESALPRLGVGGVFCVISFHSGEDRIVKTAFRAAASGSDGRWNSRRSDADFEMLTKRPVVPTEEEMSRNPRSRSAKLRAIRRGRDDGVVEFSGR